MRKKVLIYGDDVALCVLVREQLNKQEFNCDVAETLLAAFEFYMKLPYTLFVLISKGTTEEMLYHIKLFHSAKPVPIMAIYDVQQLDRVTVLEGGAAVCMDLESDLYLCTAQAGALVNIYCAQDESRHRKTLVFTPNLVIDPVYRAVVLDGKFLEFSRREFDLLFYFASHVSQALTPEQIYSKVWGEPEGQVGDAVKSCVKILRKKLSPYGHKYIQNVWGIGYRFFGDVDL